TDGLDPDPDPDRDRAVDTGPDRCPDPADDARSDPDADAGPALAAARRDTARCGSDPLGIEPPSVAPGVSYPVVEPVAVRRGRPSGARRQSSAPGVGTTERLRDPDGR
ncbi:MAG: hypothetical protein ACXWWR_08660, partial [Candidatus Limnocylindrales bacterium]